MSPGEFARTYGWSERAVRKLARDIGACHILGKTMTLTEDDCAALLEATKCPSKYTGAARSTITEALSMGADYAALVAQRTKQSRRASRWKSKRVNGKVIWMDRGAS